MIDPNELGRTLNPSSHQRRSIHRSVEVGRWRFVPCGRDWTRPREGNNSAAIRVGSHRKPSVVWPKLQYLVPVHSEGGEFQSGHLVGPWLAEELLYHQQLIRWARPGQFHHRPTGQLVKRNAISARSFNESNPCPLYAQ
jgi:hypothetical protein